MEYSNTFSIWRAWKQVMVGECRVKNNYCMLGALQRPFWDPAFLSKGRDALTLLSKKKLLCGVNCDFWILSWDIAVPSWIWAGIAHIRFGSILAYFWIRTWLVWHHPYVFSIPQALWLSGLQVQFTHKPKCCDHVIVWGPLTLVLKVVPIV